MPEIKTTIQNAHIVKEYFFPYLQHLKKTQLINVQSQHRMSAEVLFTIAINCLLTDVERMIEKKIFNTTGERLKLKLSDAEAVVLYRSLTTLPIPEKQYFLNNIRNNWLQQLDGQLIASNIYQAGQEAPVKIDQQPFDYASLVDGD